jgi:hypothetical protein
LEILKGKKLREERKRVIKERPKGRKYQRKIVVEIK